MTNKKLHFALKYTALHIGVIVLGLMSHLSLLSFLIYLNFGIITFFYLGKRSKLNGAFLVFCTSMAIWSFAYAFVYASTDMLTRQIWVKISSLGWCTFEVNLLMIVLLYTGSSLIKRNKFIALLYSIAFFQVVLDFVFFWPALQTPLAVTVLFYIINIGYSLFCFIASLKILFDYYFKLKREGKGAHHQVLFIQFLILIPILLYFALKVYGFIFYHSAAVFDIGHILAILPAVGLFVVITKFGVFDNDKLFIETILKGMGELLLIVDEKLIIRQANRRTEELLGYSQSEIVGRPVTDLFKDLPLIENTDENIEDKKTYVFEELNCQKKDGNYLPVKAQLTVPGKRLLYRGASTVMLAQDITLLKQLQMEIAWHKETKEDILRIAYHDYLTGLPNRKLLYEKISDEIENSEQNAGTFAVFYIDLDNFKTVNDLYGHEAGDALLCEAGRVIKSCLRQSDLVARVGGDEFVILVSDTVSKQGFNVIADKLNAALTSMVFYDNIKFPIEASIGYSVYPADGLNPRELINMADKSMYIKKKQRKA